MCGGVWARQRLDGASGGGGVVARDVAYARANGGAVHLGVAVPQRSAAWLRVRPGR